MSLALISGIGIVVNNIVKAEGENETAPVPTTGVVEQTTAEPNFFFYGIKEIKDVSEGDSITLIYDGEYIGDVYSYEWHKRKYIGDETVSEDINLGETGLSYTIGSVEATDFCEEDNDNGIRYQIDVLKNANGLDM